MKKQEAAKFLGISARTLNRYVADGKLNLGYKPGRRGREAVFDEKELAELKKELEGVKGSGRRREVPIEAKLTLTIDEATSLSGLTQKTILKAIREKKLAVVEENKIKRTDLDDFVRKLS